MSADPELEEIPTAAGDLADEGYIPPLCSTCGWRHRAGSKHGVTRPGAHAAEKLSETHAMTRLEATLARWKQAMEEHPERRVEIGPPCPICHRMKVQITNALGNTWIEDQHDREIHRRRALAGTSEHQELNLQRPRRGREDD